MLIRECFQMFCLATADYRRERLLSLCSILGLAAVLAPLLVLYGVKFGVVTTMVSRMRSDPLTLELSPVSSGHFTQDFFTSLRQEPGVAFVLPRTRSIAATMQLSNTDGNGTRRTVVCSMEPTAAGDPLPSRKESRPPLTAEQNPPRMEKPGAPSWKGLGPFSFRKPMLSRRKRRRKPRRRRRSLRPRNTLLSGTPVRKSMKRPPEQRPEAHA